MANRFKVTYPDGTAKIVNLNSPRQLIQMERKGVKIDEIRNQYADAPIEGSFRLAHAATEDHLDFEDWLNTVEITPLRDDVEPGEH